MKLNDFEAFVKAEQQICSDILTSKGKDYALNGDRLASFKQPCFITKKNPLEIWLGYWCKGTIALYDNISAGTKINPELIRDSINYLYLLTSLLKNKGKPVDQEQLMKDVQAQYDRCFEVLVEKAKRYCAGDDDRLGMFKRNAKIEMTTPEDVLGSYMVKHTNSIIQMVRANESDMNKWNEKITDHINYLFLLGALINDKEPIKTSKVSKTLEEGTTV